MIARIPGIEKSIIDLTSAWLDEAEAPGACVALIIDGVPWTAGVGFSDLERTTPITEDTRFGLYSITKMLIATMVLQLMVDDDSPSLDDTLQQWLPDLPIEQPILVRQVLNHSAGLPDYGGLAAYHEALRQHPGQSWSSAEFLARTLGSELLYAPGAGWQYSNIGYLLMRLLLERETGMPLKDVIDQRLAGPFGLASLSVAVRLDDMTNLAPGYSSTLGDDGTLENVIPRYHPGWVSHGLATATALDIARFTWLLLGEREVLPSCDLSDMLTGVPVATEHRWFVNPSYGLGLMTDPDSSFGHVAGHTGGGPGYSTAAYHFPNVEGAAVTVVALVNRDDGDFGTDLAFHLATNLAELLARSDAIDPEFAAGTSG